MLQSDTRRTPYSTESESALRRRVQRATGTETCTEKTMGHGSHGGAAGLAAPGLVPGAFRRLLGRLCGVGGGRLRAVRVLLTAACAEQER